MAAPQPTLTPLPAASDPPVHTPEWSYVRIGAPRWFAITLAVALLVTAALLLWSRTQLGDQITRLEAEVSVLKNGVATLETTLAARNHTIAAQGERLDSVRSRLTDIQSLLDEPLP